MKWKAKQNRGYPPNKLKPRCWRGWKNDNHHTPVDSLPVFVLQHLCTGREGRTPCRRRSSGGTPGRAPRAPEDTPGRTGACAGGGALRSSGSGWRSSRRRRSPPRSSGTPGPRENPCERSHEKQTRLLILILYNPPN